MFICSVRASTIKLFALLALTVIILVAVLAYGGDASVYAFAEGKEVNYGGMKTNEDRVAFINGFGISVESEPVKEESFSVPENFDTVLSSYNELQKSQGLDLTKYTKKRVTHYSYKVTNYNSEDEVFVNLFIYKNRIIGCDISSASPNGFVLPLCSVDASMLKNSQ